MKIFKSNPYKKNSITNKFRFKRFLHFTNFINNLPNTNTIKILDLGGTKEYWDFINEIKLNKKVEITLLNLTQISTPPRLFRL